MKILLKMAYLNLWRRKSRTIAVIAMISIGLTGLLASQGLSRGLVKQMMGDTIRSTGHLVIHKKEYRLSRRFELAIFSPEAILKILERHKKLPPDDAASISAYSARLSKNAMAQSAAKARPVQLTGITPEAESAFGELPGFIQQGKFSLTPGKKDTVIGAGLAHELGLKPGHKIIISAVDAQENLVSYALKIQGIVRTNTPGVDRSYVYLHIDTLREMLHVDDQRITEIAIRSENGDSAVLKELLSQTLGQEELELFTWLELFPFFAAVKDIMFIFEIIGYSIIFLLVAIAIFDIVLVSILERMREFGIFLAIGAPFGAIAAQIFLESLIIGILGFAGGTLLGLLSLLYLQWHGLDFSYASVALLKFGIPGIIRGTIEAYYFAMALTSTLIAVTLSAIVPVIILKKHKPVEALKFD